MPTQTRTVKSGDTLSAIAREFDTDINNISGFRSGNQDLIFPGEKLTIKGLNNEVSSQDLNNNVTTQFPAEPLVNDFEPPAFNFTDNADERSTAIDEITRLRKREDEVLSTGEERLGELTGDRQRLGTIQSQLDALALQRQGIPTRVNEQFRGRGVTQAAMSNITSQELSRNALAQLDFATEGQLLQGNINTALDLIETATEIELAPIQRKLEIEENNLNTLIDAYDDGVSTYDARIADEAKVKKEKIAAEKEALAELRRVRTDTRIIATTARNGGAPASLVAEIMKADNYEEAIRLAGNFLDKPPAKTSDSDSDSGSTSVLEAFLNQAENL